MLADLRRHARLGMLCGFIVLVMTGADAAAQHVTTLLEAAEEHYAAGAYGEAIARLHLVLEEEEDQSGSTREQAYRLLALSYVALGLPEEARDAISRLLVLDTGYEADAASDPPAYIRLVEDVTRDADVNYGASLDPADLRAGQEMDYVEVEIFYGTDRLNTGASQPRNRYGGDRGVFTLGSCLVSIPKGHQVGELESPAWYRFEFRENPARHVVLHEANEMTEQEMLARMRTVLDQSSGRGVLVFIHGYNVTFANAARRTAQLAYDLGFDGVPVLYSWPANGDLLDYTSDENDVQWTVPHLKAFLEDIVLQVGAEQVHVIAHSMGNRALTAALRDMATTHTGPVINQVVLTAPDVDADIFTRDLAPAIRSVTDRVTLYASSSDKALEVSNRIHEYPRAGQSGDHLVLVDGIDTVDASSLETDLLGHSYFAETRVLLQDLYLLLQGLTPASRNLLPMERADGQFWAFRR